MQRKINCQHNDRGAWCTNKKVRRSLWGIGARCCTEYYTFCNKCEHKKEYPRPVLPPNFGGTGEMNPNKGIDWRA